MSISSYSHVPLLIPLRSVNNTFNDPLRFSHVPLILLIRVAKMDRLGPTRKRQLGPTDRIRPRILARRLVRPDSMKTSPKNASTVVPTRKRQPYYSYSSLALLVIVPFLSHTCSLLPTLNVP